MIGVYLRMGGKNGTKYEEIKKHVDYCINKMRFQFFRGEF